MRGGRRKMTTMGRMKNDRLSPAMAAAAVVVVLAAAAGVRSAGEKKHRLTFTNQLDNKVLDVNCKNLVPYTDLGLKILLPNEEYQFEYVVNRTMAFSCNLRHGATRTVFPVSESKVRRNCGSNHCLWKAADDGIYVLNRKTKQYKLMFHWGQLYSDMHFG